jgi:hypothetical protein
MDGIVNKVAGSGLVTIDPEQIHPAGERVVLDIAPQLYQGQILREKDFREFIRQHDWKSYRGKIVRVTCSSEAIVPAWAYMLLSVALQPFASSVHLCSENELETVLFAEALATLDIEQYRDARVVIKGCSDKTIPVNAYVMLTSRLLPVVKSIMFGEPCSTVPLYKKKSETKPPAA